MNSFVGIMFQEKKGMTAPTVALCQEVEYGNRNGRFKQDLFEIFAVISKNYISKK